MDREQEATIAADDTSDAFVGRWNRLVSTTNWEKGRIIHEWRAAKMADNAPTTEFSDEAWSRIVNGNVTGQHAGRLRRVYERFGDVYTQYDGLYWSHFQSTLDWDDAEMWLEGAVQNGWSVANMRRERWQTMGSVAADEPKPEDVVVAEVDEDFATDDSDATPSNNAEYSDEARSPAGPDFGDEDDVPAANRHVGAEGESAVIGDPEEIVRPFADLPDLPEDVASAFEAYQLAILRHKGEEWSEISRDDLVASLESLKALALVES